MPASSRQKPFSRLQKIALAAFLAFSCMLQAPALAQSPSEPARGSVERKEILDAVRPLAEARLRTPVEFVVSWMRSANGWAFVSLAPQRPGGAAIDLKTTVFADEAEYMDGAQTYALLRYQFDRWNIIDFAVGPTDVFWQGDPLYRQVPAGLTPY